MNGPLSPQTLALTSTCRTISWSRLRGGHDMCEHDGRGKTKDEHKTTESPSQGFSKTHLQFWSWGGGK